MTQTETVRHFRPYQHVERFGTVQVKDIAAGRVHVFPKLDGTNGSIWWDRGIQCASRTRPLVLGVNDNFGFCTWLNGDSQEATNIRKFCEANPDVILYGEWLVPHGVKNYIETAWRSFHVFDVYDRAVNKYMPYSEYAPQLQAAGVKFIILLTELDCPSELALQELANTCGYLTTEGPGEGIVVKRYDWSNQFGDVVWAKVVSTTFVNVGGRKAKTRDLAATTDGLELDLAERVTAHLVNKHREAMMAKLSEGVDLSAPNARELFEVKNRGKIIPAVLGLVYKDIIEEELYDFVKKKKNPTVDFKALNAAVISKVKALAADLF